MQELIITTILEVIKSLKHITTILEVIKSPEHITTILGVIKTAVHIAIIGIIILIIRKITKITIEFGKDK